MIQMSLMVMIMITMTKPIKKITLAHTTQSRQPWWKVTPPTVSESVGESGWLQLGKMMMMMMLMMMTKMTR